MTCEQRKWYGRAIEYRYHADHTEDGKREYWLTAAQRAWDMYLDLIAIAPPLAIVTAWGEHHDAA